MITTSALVMFLIGRDISSGFHTSSTPEEKVVFITAGFPQTGISTNWGTQVDDIFYKTVWSVSIHQDFLLGSNNQIHS